MGLAPSQINFEFRRRNSKFYGFNFQLLVGEVVSSNLVEPKKFKNHPLRGMVLNFLVEQDSAPASAAASLAALAQHAAL